MLLLGHRGAPREAPENTLASFQAALRAGADGVELDVRLCATGEVVCCHDPTLQRLAGEDVRVRTTAWADLQRHDLGGGARVCLLDDALDLVGPHGVVNVELKHDDVDAPALARATVAALSRAARGAVIASSFDLATLAALTALRPRLPRGLLIPPLRYPESRSYLAAVTRPGAFHAVHPWHEDVTRERVAAWRGCGLDTNTWTVDDPARVAALRDLGAAMVISNTPASVAPSVRVEGDDARRRELRDRLLQR